MIIKKLSRMPYAQAHVEIMDNGDIHLFSYTTLVATIDADGWFSITGLYSMTIRKHIGAFVAEYITYPNGEHMTYQEAKDIYNAGLRFNIKTGEVEFLNGRE